MSLYSCLIFPACNSHLFYVKLYCHMWLVCLYNTVCLYHTFPTEHRVCILIFVRVLSEIYLILRRIQPEAIINLHRCLNEASVHYQPTNSLT